MKALLIGLLLLGSFSAFAQEKIWIEKPSLSIGTKELGIHSDSNPDQTCKALGFDEANAGTKGVSGFPSFADRVLIDEKGEQKITFDKDYSISVISCIRH